MPEEKDKKINYKILTVEHLLKEEIPPAKEIKHKEEKIEVPVIEKIEERKKELPPQETKEITEIPSEEIFYKPAEDKKISQLKSESVKEKEEIPKQSINLPFNLIRYILITGGLILIIGSIIYFKPYEKVKNLFVFKEKSKPSEEVQTQIPTPAPIVFPSVLVTTTEINTETITEATSSVKIQPALLQGSSYQEISFLHNFASVDIPIKDLNSFQKELNIFLNKQELVGYKVKVNLFYNQNNLPYEYLFNYFIKPSKNSFSIIEAIKNDLVGDYGFLLYYGYTRKYPLLIFEIKDKEKVTKLNQQWEKLSMRDDLKTLFLGAEPPKTKNNFVTKKINNFNYRILDFGDNYKIIWAIINNYLIYSTTETGLSEIINYLQ